MARVIIAIPSYPWITSNHILFFRWAIIIPKSKLTKQRYDELELNLLSLFYQLNVVSKQFVLMIERKWHTSSNYWSNNFPVISQFEPLDTGCLRTYKDIRIMLWINLFRVMLRFSHYTFIYHMSMKYCSNWILV